MKRLLMVVVGGLLIAAVLIILVELLGLAKGGEKKVRDAAPAEKQSSSKSGRASRPDVSPKDAVRELKGFLRDGPVSGYRFEDIERLARGLSDADLHDLIGQVGFEDWVGMPGWIRSALYAEWGRREPGALEELKALTEGKTGQESTGVNQALYSFFRGKIEREAVTKEVASAIMADLVEVVGKPSYLGWTGMATRELYSAFAQNDPEAAWQALPVASENPQQLPNIRIAALKGVFRGVDTVEEAREYIGRWQAEWRTPEAIRAHDSYHENIMRVSFHIPEPPLEKVGEEAALALAQFGLREAEQWLNENAPGNDSRLGTRRYSLQYAWATHNPDEALALLSNPEYADAHHGLSSGILFADSTRAVEVGEALGATRARQTSLGSAVTHGAHNMMSDAYPGPDSISRLPNYRERYDALREAVRVGGFSDRDQSRMLDQLERGFQEALSED